MGRLLSKGREAAVDNDRTTRKTGFLIVERRPDAYPNSDLTILALNNHRDPRIDSPCGQGVSIRNAHLKLLSRNSFTLASAGRMMFSSIDAITSSKM
jgi:hypothetical protein